MIVSTISMSIPQFQLHDSLRGTLSQGIINRVSFYSILRDINQEVLDNFDSGGGGNQIQPNLEEEQNGILIISCNDDDESNNEPLFNVDASTTRQQGILIDEEWWLVSVIASRTPESIRNQSAELLPTFFEAMGENDGDEVSPSKTKLWKPSQSWWDAKSGKNPWVEPAVHDNRWRYLWPLIHYHKFIAKCIKKLKRNNIDVKTSVSNVSLFLRQEVCSVSDHLANMSKYDSESWTLALSHFVGWVDNDPQTIHVEETLRSLVASQQLTNLHEIASLRCQLDDTILKAILYASNNNETIGDSHHRQEVRRARRQRMEDYFGAFCMQQSSNVSTVSGSVNDTSTIWTDQHHPSYWSSSNHARHHSLPVTTPSRQDTPVYSNTPPYHSINTPPLRQDYNRSMASDTSWSSHSASFHYPHPQYAPPAYNPPLQQGTPYYPQYPQQEYLQHPQQQQFPQYQYPPSSQQYTYPRPDPQQYHHRMASGTSFSTVYPQQQYPSPHPHQAQRQTPQASRPLSRGEDPPGHYQAPSSDYGGQLYQYQHPTPTRPPQEDHQESEGNRGSRRRQYQGGPPV